MGMKNNIQVSLDFGFEAEHTGGVSNYSTITGKVQKDLEKENGMKLNELDAGVIYDGYPEVSIFKNTPVKDEITGKLKNNYDSIRLRLVDDEEYLDCYANIPKIDENGFINELNEYFDFYRTGFDLVFSFMKFFDETSVLDENGTVDKINKVNIENICKYIDSQEKVEIKVTNGAGNGYNSFIISKME